MKLLLYSHFFAPSIGGVESIVLSLARGLSEIRTSEGANEFEVTLVTQTSGGDFDDSALPFRVFRQPRFARLLTMIRSSDVLHIAGPSLVPILLGWLMRKPVVIEHHGFQTICPTGQLLIEPSGIPCPGHFMAGRYVECLHCGSGSGWFHSWKLWLLTFVRRFLCSRVAVNVMPTEWLTRLTKLRNTTTIPHGIEIVSETCEPHNSSDPPCIIFQGRVVTTKGLPVLLEAATILRMQNQAFQILVIGDGPERSANEKLAEKLHLSSFVHFVGKVSPAELESLFARASFVVLPSLGGEVFGLVLAETMSRALPVIASNLGSFAEVLGDAGLTFRVGDARDLAKQITRLLDDPSLRSALSCRARKRVSDRYLRSDMIQAHAQLYRRLS